MKGQKDGAIEGGRDGRMNGGKKRKRGGGGGGGGGRERVRVS